MTSWPSGRSIVGFDDIDLLAIVRPLLTTLCLPSYKTGRLPTELKPDNEGSRDGPAAPASAAAHMTREQGGDVHGTRLAALRALYVV
jgi:hypothetical protein